MIKRPEASKIIKEHLGVFFKGLGYKAVKKNGILAVFDKSDENYHYSFHCYIDTYNQYKFIYGFEFGINKIVSVLREIDANMPLTKAVYEIRNSITGISPGQLLDPLDISKAYKYFDSKETLIPILQEVESFYKNQVVPYNQKYSDVVELDKLFNSFDNFWIDCWGKFPRLSHFHITRLIVAKLAHNPHFDEVVERNYQALESLFIRDGGIFPRNDLTRPEVYASEYLKKLII